MQLEQSVLPPTPEHVRVQTPPRYHQNTYTCWEFLYHQIFSFVLCVLCVLSLCRTKPLFISYPLFWLQNNEKDWNKKQVVPGTFTWTRWTSHPQGTNPTVWLLRHQQGRVTPTDSIVTIKRSPCVVPPPCQLIWMARELLCVSFAPHFPYFVARRHVSCSNLAHMLAFARVNVCYTFFVEARHDLGFCR